MELITATINCVELQEQFQMRIANGLRTTHDAQRSYAIADCMKYMYSNQVAARITRTALYWAAYIQYYQTKRLP